MELLSEEIQYEQRARLLTLFVDVAEYCYTIHNLHIMSAIAAGLAKPWFGLSGATKITKSAMWKNTGLQGGERARERERERERESE